MGSSKNLVQSVVSDLLNATHPDGSPDLQKRQRGVELYLKSPEMFTEESELEVPEGFIRYRIVAGFQDDTPADVARRKKTGVPAWEEQEPHKTVLLSDEEFEVEHAKWRALQAEKAKWRADFKPDPALGPTMKPNLPPEPDPEAREAFTVGVDPLELEPEPGTIDLREPAPIPPWKTPEAVARIKAERNAPQ